MLSSEAPAQIISTVSSQKTLVFSRPPIVMPSPSATTGSMGQVAKFQILYSGTNAQMQASQRQAPVPNTAKKAADPRITPTEPQQ